MPTLAQTSNPRRRGDARERVSISASVFCSYFDTPVEVSATDVSAGGMVLDSDLLLHAGERVLVAFTVPGTRHRILVGADVVRTERAGFGGMGLEFGRLVGSDEKALRAGLDRHRGLQERLTTTDSSYRC